MKCPNCGGRLHIKVGDSRELLLMCEKASFKMEACHYAVGIHELPIFEKELQEIIDTAPQFLLRTSMEGK